MSSQSGGGVSQGEQSKTERADWELPPLMARLLWESLRWAQIKGDKNAKGLILKPPQASAGSGYAAESRAHAQPSNSHEESAMTVAVVLGGVTQHSACLF